MSAGVRPRINVLLSPFQNAFFAELAEVVVAELGQAGVDARLVTEPEHITPDAADVFVLLPAHEWIAVEGDEWLADERRVARTIGIGAEQPGSIFFQRNADVGRRIAALFDFSERAVAAFRHVGVDALHLPFGHTARWDRYRPEGNDGGPDVVFLGNFKERRLDALGQMARTLGRHRTHLVLGDNSAPNTASSRWFVAGDDKRELLASSRVLLNIHQSDEPYFEWLRFTEAALAGTVVLSEPSTHCEPYQPGTHFAVAPLAQMGDELDALLADPGRLATIRQAAYDAVCAHPFAEGLTALVDVAAQLTTRPIPGRLPPRTRREPIGHRNAAAARPNTAAARPTSAAGQPTTTTTTAGEGDRPAVWTQLFVVGNLDVTAPRSTPAGEVELIHVADRRVALAAMRASAADAVGMIDRPATVTTVGIEELQRRIASGAEAAAGMVAEQRRDHWTLLGLWQPAGEVDVAALDTGWVLARPSQIDGCGAVARDTTIDHVPMPVFIADTPRPDGVVVVMATFNPAPGLFHRQVESLRRQTLDDFVCVVSDDGSDASHLAMMRQELAGDRRFRLVEHATNAGFYANFERGIEHALALSPEFVALADQDDHWYPQKLARGVEVLRSSGASLVFTDLAPVDEARRLLSPSFFARRHPTVESVLDLTMMNSVTGATAMFRADLARVALPFPPARYRSFHDHWLARCAQVDRGLAFDPRVSMEYVQHGENIQGFAPSRPRFADFRAAIAAHREGRADPTLDIELVVARLAELRLLEQRGGSSRGLRRAIRMHERYRRGGRLAVASLLTSWFVDQHLRRRPRHESIELRYVRAALGARAAARGSNGT